MSFFGARPGSSCHELANLLPVCVVGETHPNTIMAGSSRAEEWTANRQQRFAFFRVGAQHE